MALMKAPENGAAVRMYRQGHGDCFLIAFPRKGGRRPVYVMIDCGYKPGSQIERDGKKIDADKVVRNIASATNKKIDIVIVTHEHQDHVNALGKFKNFEFGQAWFAWTEDPADDDANELRRRHEDQLLGLVKARNQLSDLALNGNDRAATSVGRLDQLLSLELGGAEDDDEEGEADPNPTGGEQISVTLPLSFGASGEAPDPSRSQNKRAMKVIKDRSKKLVYIRPHDGIIDVADADGVRAFALGPPKNEDLLKDEDPKGDTAFPGHHLVGESSLSFFAAAANQEGAAQGAPFSVAHGLNKDEAFTDPEYGGFFTKYYGAGETEDEQNEIASNAEWRRIDEEWLYAAESFALKLNRGVNNTSLVLAFELEKTGKVLLFAADAQNGNWKSWDDGRWQDGTKTITAKKLLKQTVLYKVGHHGSHNATLKGETSSNYPNLSWMAHGAYAKEFTAMITANRDWAINKADWNHPLPSIKEALRKKAAGRVFQIDSELPDKLADVLQSEWDEFTSSKRTNITNEYIEYTIFDEW